MQFSNFPNFKAPSAKLPIMQTLSTGLHSTLVPIFADIIGLNCRARVLDRSGNRPTRGRARVATPWQLVLVNVIVGVVLSNALWWSLALDLFLWRYFLKKATGFCFFYPSTCVKWTRVTLLTFIRLLSQFLW